MFTCIVGTMRNSFSWPAQQVSYKDVANKSFPEGFVSWVVLRT
jgi:hypothetical protein